MLTAFITISCVAISVSAKETSNEETIAYSNASFLKEEGLLNSLGFVNILDTNIVTRGEFVVSTAKLLDLHTEGFTDSVSYKDIDSSSELYGSAGMLCSLGVLSESEYFYPDAQITENEAAKIAVSALGYDYEARERGGWPSGYAMLGSSLGLTRCFNGDGTVSREEFILLMYEFINSNVA